ncbi:hypothetical protein O6H91_03G099300 [Diphasiastrum complanatum]|uniref:Uncharacterized protein n=2 Tax=Diphasiastrum complanatum TaxID=34168 RepID=A0ACC2E9L7_DIPCM|nr:hypothetical protein O6H91_03G099300 [Diphasiastrum complanatum]
MARRKPLVRAPMASSSSSSSSTRNKMPTFLREAWGQSSGLLKVGCFILLLSLIAFVLPPAGVRFFNTNFDPDRLDVKESVKIYDYEIVREFHHDPEAFIQGLVYAGDDTLYESTGLFGKSTIREVDLRSGQVRQLHHMEKNFFGEGLTLFNERLLQVVWLATKGFIYNRTSLALLGTFVHSMKDGWGLTNDGKSIIGSDGSSSLYFLRPTNFSELYHVIVKDNGREVEHLNELEYVNGEVWANVYQTECIARISPEDGRVVGWILLHGLRNKLISDNRQVDVLNGIAWDQKEDRLFFTGKLWPRLYELKLKPLPRQSESQLAAVRESCIFHHRGH